MVWYLWCFRGQRRWARPMTHWWQWVFTCRTVWAKKYTEWHAVVSNATVMNEFPIEGWKGFRTAVVSMLQRESEPCGCLRPELLPEALLMCLACIATWGHVAICGSCCCQGPWLGQWSCCNFRSLCGPCGSCYTRRPCRYLGMFGTRVLLQSGAVLMFMACATTKGNADVHSLCCYLKSCWYSWAVMPPWAMSGSVVLLQLGSKLVSTAHVTNEGHEDVHGLGCHQDYIGVHGPYCHWRPCWGTSHMLMPEARWMSVVCAVDRHHELSSCWL